MQKTAEVVLFHHAQGLTPCGDQHYFADSSLPSCEPAAATLLVQRVLEFVRTR